MFNIYHDRVRREINASTEWEAVEEFTTQYRKARPNRARSLLRGFPRDRFIRINGKRFNVVGVNQTGSRIAYRG